MSAVPPPAFAPDARARLRRVFVRRLAVQARLGIHPPEIAEAQRVLISIEALVEDDAAPHAEGPDRISRVVDYAGLADTARRIAGAGHIRLAETLAERIALALLADLRLSAARVTVEKPDILPDSEGVGVTVERIRPGC
jgi:dihydroneopterin aldolase